MSPRHPHHDELARYVVYIPHIRELGMTLDELSQGYCVLGLPYRDELIGNPETGDLHGGVITTLIDSACGLCVLAAMPDPGPIATLDLRIDYLRPGEPKRAVIAEAECYHLARHIAFVRSSARHAPDEPPIATAQASFIIKSSGGGLAADVPASGQMR
jgi:uncharacterized protein (TIGR00369 family)